jgi:putative intracellular protease/amidase
MNVGVISLHPTAVVCHATSVLLDARDSAGELIVTGKRWTGFTAAEEEYVEANVGRRFQPFWIELEAAKIPQTTFVAGEPMSNLAHEERPMEVARALLPALTGRSDATGPRRIPTSNGNPDGYRCRRVGSA